nr:hypothetical protein [Tanacetum cinerariifolium]
GRVVPLIDVNDQENANVQGVGGDNVNEEVGDTAMADQVEEGSEKEKKADGASDSNHPPKKLRVDDGTSGDVVASTGGKSLATIQELFEQSTLNVEIGVMAAATVPFVTSSVTPTPELLTYSSHHSGTNVADDEVTSIVRLSMSPHPLLTAVVTTTVIDDVAFIPTPGARTRPVPHSIFIDSASIGEANQDVACPFHPVGTKLFVDLFCVSQDVDSETLHQTYIPKWNVMNDSILDEPEVFRGVIDHLAPLALFSQLRSMDYEQLFIKFNVGTARQTCLSSKVRLQLEHELRGRKKFEDKCVMQAGWLKERDAEIASLKAQLSLKKLRPQRQFASRVRLPPLKLLRPL